MPKKVEALANGFYGGKRIRKGGVFVLDDNDKVGKWMKVLKDVPAEPSQDADEKAALIEKAKSLNIAATKNWGVEKLKAAIAEVEEAKATAEAAEVAAAEAAQQA